MAMSAMPLLGIQLSAHYKLLAVRTLLVELKKDLTKLLETKKILLQDNQHPHKMLSTMNLKNKDRVHSLSDKILIIFSQKMTTPSTDLLRPLLQSLK
jgi:hypothetical protein